MTVGDKWRQTIDKMTFGDKWRQIRDKSETNGDNLETKSDTIKKTL